jgi:tRNA 2-thiouridine synthesizing protein A
MSGRTPAAVVDIRAEVCPMTYVRTKLALEALAPGDVLEVRLRGEEPARNVPASACEEGHTVLSLSPQPDGSLVLLLKKGGGALR